MARIKDSSVEAVKSAVDLVALVEGYTRLRKSGGRFVGLCPFHQEKTPSFGVSPERGTFKCFGCGEGGDAISFVEKLENVDFVGAIEFLAQRFAVPLEYEESSPEQDRERRRRERLFQLLDRAATFYERYLWDSEAGRFAREYLASRGLYEEVCREFRLGLAPGASALARAATAQGFTREELAAAGLVNRRGDYFSRRLLFPLADARGRVRGFQARRLHDDDPLRAKYVNSPEGDLFRKGDLLYGLDHARTAIAKQDRAVIVEGNTDVIALRQAGFEPVVASMGTALTERQLKELVRLSKRLFLCFDADAAGQEATLRGMKLAFDAGFDVQVVGLERGKDPADDPDAFVQHLQSAKPLVRYWVEAETRRAPGAQAAFDRGQEVLAQFSDSPERQEAVRFLADRLGLSRDLQAGLAPRASRATGSVSPKLLERDTALELDALAGVVAHEELLPALVELGERHFSDGKAREIAGAAIARRSLPSDVLAELHARADLHGITKLVAEQLLLRLRERELKREVTNAEPERKRELAQLIEKLQEQVERLSLQSAGADPR